MCLQQQKDVTTIFYWFVQSQNAFETATIKDLLLSTKRFCASNNFFCCSNFFAVHDLVNVARHFSQGKHKPPLQKILLFTSGSPVAEKWPMMTPMMMPMAVPMPSTMKDDLLTTMVDILLDEADPPPAACSACQVDYWM